MTEEQKKIPKATHEGTLHIGNIELRCAVLDTGQRVLTQSDFMRALGRARQAKGRQYYKGDVNLPAFLNSQNLMPFVPKDLQVTSSQIEFKPLRGKIAFGYPAELLPKVCDVFWEAEQADVLTTGQKHIAERAKILTRGLAHVGIIALVDEATGYQEVRDKLALQAILDKFLRKEFADWAKRFPDEFYKQMFRLRGWQWRGMRVNRPSVVGKYTNDLVYQRLAPGILEKLQEMNPKDDKGQREGKHHQLLTDDIGLPALQNHLFATTKFMEASATWDQFYRSMQRAFPKLNSNLLLNFPEPETESA